MSNYTGKERTFLTHVARLLGARYNGVNFWLLNYEDIDYLLAFRSQDTFARRTYLNKDTYGCTHLICPIPEGGKYAAAVKWKLPAVTAEWLLECLAQERRVDETPYLVGETIGKIDIHLFAAVFKQTIAYSSRKTYRSSDGYAEAGESRLSNGTTFRCKYQTGSDS